MHFSLALAQNTTGVTTATTMATAGGNGPLAPHMSPCALRQCVKLIGDNLPSKQIRYNFGGVDGVYGPQNTPMLWWCIITTTSECLEGRTHPHHHKKLYPLAWGLLPIQLTCWHGTQGLLGDHFCRRWPWSAMAELVAVGHWRLTSDQLTVGIVKIAYGSIFLFLRRTHTFLTSDLVAKKSDLGENKLVL